MSDYDDRWRRERGDRNRDPNQYSRYGRDEDWEDRFGPEDYGGGASRGGVDFERGGFQIRGGSSGSGGGGGGWGRDAATGGRADRADWNREDWGRVDRGMADRGRQARRDVGRDYARGRSERMGEDRDRGWMDRIGDEVASWWGDEDAERRRRMDAMRSHRGRGPRGYARSDDRIREDVSDRLTDDPYVDASDIDVTVSGGEVTLSGHVDHRTARRRAEDIAESVSGVTHVQNNLRVRRDTGTAAGASAMAGMEGGRRMRR